MSLSLTFDAVLSRVRVQVTALPPATSYAVVERSTDQVRWTTVRGAAAMTPAGGAAAVDDYEFAADVLNYYRVRAYTAAGDELGPTLNANPYFETDAVPWTTLGGSVVRSTAQAHEGVASLLLTPDGVSSTVQARAENVAATVGWEVQAAAWVRCAVSRSVNVAINWRDAGSSIVSTSTSAPIALTAGVWTYVELKATAPASAAFAQLIPLSMGGTPPAGHTCHVDEAGISRVGSGVGPVFADSITPTLGGVWLKSVTRPFLNRQVTVVDYSEVEQRSRAGVFDVVGRGLPVSVTEVRGSQRWTLEVLASDQGEAEDLTLLLASGDVLLVHVPAGSRVPAGYVVVGDTRRSRPGRRSARRVFALPCTQVAAPGPDVVGATVTCQTVLNTYATCADVVAAHPTILDLLELVGDPTDVLVP